MKTSENWGETWTSRFMNLNSPNRLNPKKPTLRHVIIKLSKVKDKERIFKQKEKGNSSHTRELSENYQKKLCRPAESGMIYSRY